MGASKNLEIRCNEQQAQLLATAISAYAEAAYPDGGSECAQVSRETLFTSAKRIAQEAGSTQGAQISRRQRGMLKAAVDWYFSDDGPGNSQLHDELLSFVQRPKA